MNGFDRTIIAGNVAQEPIIRKTVTGRDVLFLNIAIAKDKMNEDGTRVQSVAFIPVGIFGTKAEKLQRLIAKGTCVCIEGHHAVHDKIKLSIVVDDIQIIGSTALSSKKPAEKELFNNNSQQPASDNFGDLDPDD